MSGATANTGATVSPGVHGIQVTTPCQFPCPEIFTGKMEDAEDFFYTIKSFMALQDPDYTRELEWIETMDYDAQITDDMYYKMNEQTNTMEEIPGLRQRATNLHHVLVQLCRGKAVRKAKTTSNNNGYQTYHKLINNFRPPVQQRSLGRLVRIIRPELQKPGQTFEDGFQAWEEEVQKFEKEVQWELPDIIKVAIIMTLVTGALAEHFRLNASYTSKWSEVRNTLLSYFRTKTAYNPKDYFKTTTDPDAMDIGSLLHAFVKGKYKGQGKGKGKGKYNKYKGKGGYKGQGSYKGYGKYNKGKGKSSYKGYGKGYPKGKGSYKGYGKGTSWKGKGDYYKKKKTWKESDKQETMTDTALIKLLQALQNSGTINTAQVNQIKQQLQDA